MEVIHCIAFGWSLTMTDLPAQETTFLLSKPENELRLHSILEQIYEDLGSYSETSVLLDEANTLDLKLFPVNPNPAVVRDWDIPIPLGSLRDMRDESWDTTMYALAAEIDGTSSVKRLANKADVDLPLARECIQHLLWAVFPDVDDNKH
jgi:hypothetical protein